MTSVNEHDEYFKMMRAREDRIRTFMQLELEACLEEVSWSIRCYNCQVLGCPQEEYPARLLPTLPPNYEDNLQNRLRRAQKGIFSASLKMILKSEYQLPVLRSVHEISVQPDSVIGEHRAGKNSTTSECDQSPRRAAVVTRSEPGTPPHSPAISTESGPEEPQAESMDGLLDKNVTSTKQEEPALLCQQNVGVDDEEKETTTTTKQADVRKFVSPTEKQQQQRMETWSTDQSKQFDRGKLLRCKIPFSCEKYFACTVLSSLLCLFSFLFVFVLSTARLSCFSTFRNLPNQVQKAIGAIEACQMDDLLYQERSTDHLDFSPIKGIFSIQYLFVRLYFSLIVFEMISLSWKRTDL